jgi:hypothetical protein
MALLGSGVGMEGWVGGEALCMRRNEAVTGSWAGFAAGGCGMEKKF